MNRLAQSQSLYLRKHAENPIDWWPWCDEALQKAVAEDKPIFLSVGYSSCHWCTVMEGEAFSDAEIAAYLNANFVPIKVDREERPDVDSIYMQALQMLTGQGGWPLNIFLTPSDRIPFYGGTYFPMEPRYGRPGFLDLLNALHQFYKTDKDKLAGIQTEVLKGLQQSVELPQDPETRLTADLLNAGLAANTKVLARVAPGTPSFPMIPYAQCVLQGSRLSEHAPALEAAKRRGDDLALGGIYDHVAGGFHRYTVDATWTVPHFEKMLYDNGQIMEYLADLWTAGIREPAYEQAVAGTVAWLQREMIAPEGYFYAAQDADSFKTPRNAEPEEGAFYIWTDAELTQALNIEEFQALQTMFFVAPQGNFEGSTVLQRQKGGARSPELQAALDKLFTIRYGASRAEVTTFPPARDNQAAKTTAWPGRIPAVTDTKMIVAWNSLMISGLARAATVFDLAPALELATRAAQFILTHQWQDGRLHRLNYDGQISVAAQSEDYALLIKALLDLHQATQNQDWLDAAIKVQTEFDAQLWDAEQQGYINASPQTSQDLIIQERSYIDNATPAANGIAVANLIRLSLLAESETYCDRAEQTLQAFSGILQASPTACPGLVNGLDWFLHGTSVRTQSETITQLQGQWSPKATYNVTTDLPPDAWGLVCRSFACLPPALTLAELEEQIQKSQGMSEAET
ncbi:MAG: thioredoxin domain-containing protein [Spirulina sp. SIO3F2]|nr:thioredoxin domain-containing protein [Spirulina sp. SIO3F2]